MFSSEYKEIWINEINRGTFLLKKKNFNILESILKHLLFIIQNTLNEQLLEKSCNLLLNILYNEEINNKKQNQTNFLNIFIQLNIINILIELLESSFEFNNFLLKYILKKN